MYDHLVEKYGEKGYAKVYLKDENFEESIKKLRKALKNKETFIKRIEEIVQIN